MGKRRLRFDQRKNYELLKYAPKSLTVSIPLSNSVMALRVSLPLRYSTLYMRSPTTKIVTLHTRIVASQVLLPGWTIFLHPQSLTQCQLCCKPPHLETVAVLSLIIDTKCSWSLTAHGYTAVEVLVTDVLRGVPVVVSSVWDVCTVISALKESTVCIGNVEQKYITLIEHNRGSMTQQRLNEKQFRYSYENIFHLNNTYTYYYTCVFW